MRYSIPHEGPEDDFYWPQTELDPEDEEWFNFLEALELTPPPPIEWPEEVAA